MQGGTNNCYYSANQLVRSGKLASVAITVESSPAWHYYIRAPDARAFVVWSDMISEPSSKLFYCNADYRGHCNTSCSDPLYCYY